MTVNAKVSVFDLVEEANKVIDTVPVDEAVAMHGDPGVVFVDLRDVRELGARRPHPGGVSHAARHGGVLGRSGEPVLQVRRLPARTSGSPSTATGTGARRSRLRSRSESDWSVCATSKAGIPHGRRRAGRPRCTNAGESDVTPARGRAACARPPREPSPYRRASRCRM